MENTLLRRLIAEFIGTALLLTTVVGSGIMAERLAGGNQALALLANTLPTGAILTVLILVFGPISGAHFNPVVTIVFVSRRTLPLADGIYYLIIQLLGGIAGVMLAHAMFELPLFQLGTHPRTGLGQWIAEGVATAGLIITILGCLRAHPSMVPYAVGLYITAAYWFTASTSFANPAVTIARSLTATFSGIAFSDAPAFIAVQFAAALLAAIGWRWLSSGLRSS